MIKPLNDYVLITVARLEKSSGGIIIPGGMLDDNTILTGVVVSDSTSHLYENDTVIFNKVKSFKIEPEDKNSTIDLYLTKYEDILAVTKQSDIF